MKKPYIEIYTDGSSRGNPGPGGCAAIIKYKDDTREISQGFRKSTNNRMELMAIILALQSLKDYEIPIKIYSDSKYVVDSIKKKWLDAWIKIDFKKKKNKDLWIKYYNLSKNFNIEINWIKGHNEHTENELCDKMAVGASCNQNLLVDTGYELVGRKI